MLSQERYTREVQAGFTSMLDPTTEYLGDTYYNTIDTQTEQGESPVSDGYRVAVQQEKNAVIDDNLSDIVANPAISDETKELLIKGEHKNVNPDPIPVQVMDELAKAPEAGETQEMRFRRGNLNMLKKQVYEYQSAKQGYLDGTRLNDKTTLGVDVANIGSAFMPFIEQAGVADAVKELGGDNLEVATAVFLMGEGKSKLRSIMANMPLDQRLDAMDQIVNAIEEGNSLFGVSHDRAIREQLRIALMESDYDTFDRTFDNLISASEAVGVGYLAKQGSNFIKGVGKAFGIGKESSIARKVDMSQVKSTVQEVSPKRTADLINEDVSKDMADAIVKDNSDETAKALTGTTRQEAVSDMASVEPIMPDGSVRYKPEFDGMDIQEAAAYSRIQEHLTELSVNAYTQKELESASATMTHKLANVTGVTAKTNMTQVGVSDTGAKINMVYGTKKGGYSNPTRAIQSVEKALADYGVKAEDLQLLSRNSDGDYISIDIKDAADRGDYLVQLPYEYSVRMEDVTAWEKFDVTGSWLGKAARWVLDPQSMFDPRLAVHASAKVDRASGIASDMLKLGEGFNRMHTTIDIARQEKVMSYLKEANEKGLAFNVRDLQSRGFTDYEIEGMKSFRRFWDTHWFVKNHNDVRDLSNDGFKIMQTQGSTLIGKPASTVEKGEPIFDAVTGNSRYFQSTEEMKTAIANGEVILLRTPMWVDEKVVKYAMSSEKYRDLKVGSDYVTPYRNGYFTRQYKDPYFVVQTFKDASGREFQKAIATARSTRDAELYIARMQDTDPKGVFSFRGNVSNPTERDRLFAEVDTTMGRSNLRARGQKLEDASAPVGDLSDSHILSPEDAMFRSAASVSINASMNDFIKAAETRFVKQFEKIMPKNSSGKAFYPQSSDFIGAKGMSNTSEVSDARAMYEYIESLKNGYTDTIDSTAKALLHKVAEKIGKSKIGGTKAGSELEKKVLAGADLAAPVGLTKSAAFNLYIAMNPLRQFVLNVSQTFQLAAFNPRYMASPRGASEASALWMLRQGHTVPDALVKATGKTLDELNLMSNEYLKSGLPASIATHNFRRSSLTDIARESEWAHKSDSVFRNTVEAVKSPFHMMRKIGFEMGEEVNLLVAWLAHYDKVRGSKPALNASDFQKIAADSRNFTYNMNRAGDMQYNTSALAAMMQFVQVPHKAVLTAITNKGIDKATKAQLVVLNAALFGLPGATVAPYVANTVSEILGSEPDPEVAQALSNGLMAVTFNTLASAAFDDDTQVSFKNLAPMDASAVYTVVDNIMEKGLVDAFKEGAGFSAWGQIGNTIDTALKLLGGEKWADTSDTGLQQLSNDILNLPSGLSKVMKASYALEYGVLYSQTGTVRDPSVTTPEAIMSALGFQTVYEVNKWAMRRDDQSFKKERYGDIDSALKRTYKELADVNVAGDNPTFQLKALGHMFSVMDLTPDERRYVMSKIRQRAGSDDDLLGEIIKIVNGPEGFDRADKVMLMRATPEQYKAWREAREAIEQTRIGLSEE